MRPCYILVNGEPVPANFDTWAVWFEQAGADHEAGDLNSRRVAYWERDEVSVSTVFVGLDHQYGAGPPLIFETLVRGGFHDQEMERYATRDEALAGHQRIVEMVRRRS